MVNKLCDALLDAVLKALASEGSKEVDTQIIAITHNINGYIKNEVFKRRKKPPNGNGTSSSKMRATSK